MLRPEQTFLNGDPLPCPACVPHPQATAKASFAVRRISFYGHRNLLNRRNKGLTCTGTHVHAHTRKLEVLKTTKVFFFPFLCPVTLESSLTGCRNESVETCNVSMGWSVLLKTVGPCHRNPAQGSTSSAPGGAGNPHLY